MLPTIKSGLRIGRGDLTSLAGLKDPSKSLRSIDLDDLQYLTTLDGIEGLTHLKTGPVVRLQIRGCPRLTDYTALQGATLDQFSLIGTYMVPDLSGIQMNTLRLERIVGLTDLSCLEGLDESKAINIELVGLDEITDLSGLYRLHGDHLVVSPQLETQAQALVEEGNFKEYSIEFPDESWQPDDGKVVLLSLDELKTLPKALLSRVERLSLAGDQLIDPDQFDVWMQWEEGSDKPVPYLHNQETDELSPIEMGTMTDLTDLAPLTGLRDLQVFAQPLTSLDGIQDMKELSYLQVEYCGDLTDASAAFTLQSLEGLSLNWTGVESIEGVQNLFALRTLGINNTQVTDLSPLADCDFSFAYEQGGISLWMDTSLCEDFSSLSGLERVEDLVLNNVSSDLWVHEVSDVNIRKLEACGSFGDQEDLTTFLTEHPDLEELHIPWCMNVTDLSPLLNMEHLQYVKVTPDMEAAIASLGNEYHFQLDIEG